MLGLLIFIGRVCLKGKKKNKGGSTKQGPEFTAIDGIRADCLTSCEEKCIPKKAQVEDVKCLLNCLKECQSMLNHHIFQNFIHILYIGS